MWSRRNTDADVRNYFYLIFKRVIIHTSNCIDHPIWSLAIVRLRVFYSVSASVLYVLSPAFAFGFLAAPFFRIHDQFVTLPTSLVRRKYHTRRAARPSYVDRTYNTSQVHLCNSYLPIFRTRDTWRSPLRFFSSWAGESVANSKCCAGAFWC